MNYYNEFDHHAAGWLRELIAAKFIPEGDVDERSIADVAADDLRGYTQCHFFAGVGGWSLALLLAGWPDDKPCWTGSCPCQSFSTAGKQRGFDDERDLWPVFAELIRQCRPEYVFGEQVENAIKHGWLDRIYADLEGEGYAVGAVVLGAHSVGSPHRRQRLYWGGMAVADGHSELCEWNRESGARRRDEFANCCGSDGIPHANGSRHERGISCEAGQNNRDEASGNCGNIRFPDSTGERCGETGQSGERSEEWIADGCDDGNMGNASSNHEWRDFMPGEYRERIANRGSGDVGCIPYTESDGRNARRAESDGRGIAAGCGPCGVADCDEPGLERRSGGKCSTECVVGAGGVDGFSPWLDCRLIYCRDNKIRRVPAESVFFGVADGLSGEVDGDGAVGISETGGFPLTTQKEGRAMLLKGYGNAIVPQVAAEFIMAFNEAASGGNQGETEEKP